MNLLFRMIGSVKMLVVYDCGVCSELLKGACRSDNVIHTSRVVSCSSEGSFPVSFFE